MDSEISEWQVEWKKANLPKDEKLLGSPQMREYIDWLKKHKKAEWEIYGPPDNNGCQIVTGNQVLEVELLAGVEPRIVTWDKEDNTVNIHICHGGEPYHFSAIKFTTYEGFVEELEHIITKMSWCTAKIILDMFKVFHEVQQDIRESK